MSNHIKALFVTFGVFLTIVGGYFYFSSSNKTEQSEIKQIEPSNPTLPKSDLVSLAGKTINAKDFAGKVVIINFWASWCTPCIEEVPSLVSLVKADPNIVIIAVSGDQNKDDVAAFLKSFPDFNKPPIYVILENAKSLVDQFKVNKLPESFIFNPKGELVKKVTGTINWHTADSIEYFKALRVNL